MDSHCSVESNWQWTRHLCQQSRATEFLAGGQPRECAPEEGQDLPGACGSRCSGSSGGVSPGGGRKMVPGGQHVCQVARKGQGEVGARCGATPNGAGVEALVEFDPLLHAPLQVLFSD